MEVTELETMAVDDFIVNNERYGAVPDLTAPGKTIEGGYPAGGIVGREEFMDPFSPLN